MIIIGNKLEIDDEMSLTNKIKDTLNILQLEARCIADLQVTRLNRGAICVYNITSSS